MNGIGIWMEYNEIEPLLSLSKRERPEITEEGIRFKKDTAVRTASVQN